MKNRKRIQYPYIWVYGHQCPHDVFTCDVLEELDERGKGTGNYRYMAHSENTGKIEGIGYCRNCPGHKTPEEASEHFKKWILDRCLGFRGPFPRQPKPCAICGIETTGDACIFLAPLAPLSYHFNLCTTHANRETVSRLYEPTPFHLVEWYPAENPAEWWPLCDEGMELTVSAAATTTALL